MATEQTLTTLIINKVDSKETFNKMKAQGLVNENELYLTPEGAATQQQIKVQNNEPANAVANDLWLDLDEDAPASLPISGGTLTGPLAMSNNKITGVSDPTSAQDVATKNYIDTSFLALTGGVINGNLKLNITNQSGLVFKVGTTEHKISASTNSLVITAPNIYLGNTNADNKLMTRQQCLTLCAPKVSEESASGAISKTLSDNHNYTFNNVSSLNLTAGTGSCHGFITFGSSKPTVSLHGFTKVDGDIANAAASTVWEFSCYNKYIIFKNWSDV